MKPIRSFICSLALLLAIAIPSMATTYSRILTVNLGTSRTGLAANLTYKVIDSAGSTLIAATNTGVAESPAGSGCYHVTATWDDSWVAEVQWVDTTDSLYATAPVNPVKLTAAEHTNVASDTQTGLTNQGYTAAVATNIGTTNTRVALALPAVAPAASGGLPTVNGLNQVAISNALPAVDGSNRVLLQPTQTGVTIPTVTTITNGVTVTTNNDKTGYTASTVSDKTGYSLSGSQTFSTTGAVGSVTGAVASVTGAVGSVTGNVGGSVASVTGNVGGSVASVTGAVTVGTNNDKAGYALAVAPPTLAQIYGYAPDGTVTSAGILTMILANMAGSFTNTWNSGTHTLTTVYKRQDGTTTAYTNTTVNGSTSTAPAATSRTGAVGTLP